MTETFTRPASSDDVIADFHPAHAFEIEWRYPMARGILVFLVILLLGGGVFWALVGGCIAS